MNEHKDDEPVIGQNPEEVGQLDTVADVLLTHLSPDLQTEPAQRNEEDE